MGSNFSTNIAAGASTGVEALGQQQTHGLSKTDSAARDFEALLIGQMLRSMHEESGWLGTGEDQAGEAAVSLGEEQLARSLAGSGGLGLSRLIESGLHKEEAPNHSASNPADVPAKTQPVTQKRPLPSTVNHANTTAPAISAP